MAGALDGYLVVDFTEGLCGPFASMRLSDAGASVIKVEPITGDASRRMGPPFVGTESALFLSLNRNKKSVALDVRTPAGSAIARELIRSADVVLEDFGPGEAGNLGLGYAEVGKNDPALVYCSISPFGEAGRLQRQPGSELVVQAMADYTRSLGGIGEAPVRLGADVASMNTGIMASQAVTAGLFHRIRKGEGQRVSVSMLGTLLHMRGIMWTAMTDPDEWYGFHLDNYTRAPDKGYRTKDGHVYFGLRRGSSEDWDRLMLTLGLQDYLADPRFDGFGREATSIGRYAADVKPIWEKAFKQLTNEEVIKLIHSCNGDAVPFNTYQAVCDHPQTASLEIIRDVPTNSGGSFRTIGPVWRFETTPATVKSPPPALGQHTDTVLQSVGVSSDQISSLRADKVIG